MIFDWYNAHCPHTTLEIRTPNEVYLDLPAACEKPRIEPRPLWPRSSPCASPQARLKSTRGAVHFRIDFLRGRKHLPIITLKYAA